MARTPKPYGVSVDLKLHDTDPSADSVNITLFKRIAGDADNEVVATRSYLPSVYDATIQRRGLLYGFSKLFQDRTSDESGSEGRMDSMDQVHARFLEAQWEKERESTGRSVKIEVEALAAIKGVTVGAIQKALRDLSSEARDKVLQCKAVTDKVAELQETDVEPEDLDLTDVVSEEESA